MFIVELYLFSMCRNAAVDIRGGLFGKPIYVLLSYYTLSDFLGEGFSQKHMPDLSPALAMLRLFQTLDPEFPLQYAVCFCLIARNEGLSLTQLSKEAGLSLSTTSRIVAALSENRQNGSGYHLVGVEVVPEERRRKAISLTVKGRHVIETLAEITRNITLPAATDTSSRAGRILK